MNRSMRFILSMALLLTAFQAAMGAEPSGYYNSALGRNDELLMSALRNIIRTHKQLSYNALWDAFKTTDTDAQGYIIDMYSNCKYRPNDHGGSASKVGDGFNREHSFPKSWFNDETPMYTDLFHLYPTDIKVNSQRSNYPFGVCANGTRLTNGKLYGKGKLGTSTYPGYGGIVFEPDDEYKGDFARTYFYMVTCYKNELSTWPGSPQLDRSNKYKAFSTWSINMLMEWTRLDPVSEKEIKRNDAVYSIQGNRNPFIDHPELAEFIWGNMQGEPWRGSGEVGPATITAPENGSTIDMGQTTMGTELKYTVTVKGKNLLKGLTMSMSDNEFFYVSRSSFSANEVNSGTSFDITFTADEEGTFENIITLSSDEVSTEFTITATAVKQGDTPDPPVVQGDSIMEDWEGCTTGGYWSKQVQGNTFSWFFTDAGIWGDNMRHGELSCRFGKTSSSAITMLESVSDVTAIGFYAASYGNDADAELVVSYSTNQGSSWIGLGSVTVTKGNLQHYILDVNSDWPLRFGITQASGSRVNIDDITIYRRASSPLPVAGDVNGDGEVNIADINTLIDIILSGGAADEGTLQRADVNGDSEITVADINAVISIVLSV